MRTKVADFVNGCVAGYQDTFPEQRGAVYWEDEGSEGVEKVRQAPGRMIRGEPMARRQQRSAVRRRAAPAMATLQSGGQRTDKRRLGG